MINLKENEVLAETQATELKNTLKKEVKNNKNDLGMLEQKEVEFIVKINV